MMAALNKKPEEHGQRKQHPSSRTNEGLLSLFNHSWSRAGLREALDSLSHKTKCACQQLEGEKGKRRTGSPGLSCLIGLDGVMLKSGA